MGNPELRKTKTNISPLAKKQKTNKQTIKVSISIFLTRQQKFPDQTPLKKVGTELIPRRSESSSMGLNTYITSLQALLSTFITTNLYRPIKHIRMTN